MAKKLEVLSGDLSDNKADNVFHCYRIIDLRFQMLNFKRLVGKFIVGNDDSMSELFSSLGIASLFAGQVLLR